MRDKGYGAHAVAYFKVNTFKGYGAHAVAYFKVKFKAVTMGHFFYKIEGTQLN